MHFEFLFEGFLSCRSSNKHDLQHLMPVVWWPGSSEDISYESSMGFTISALSEAINKIEEKQKQVVVEKVGQPIQTYEEFAACLPADECRYAIYDFDFVTAENCQKSKIFFIAWCPDIAKVRSKMIYASSKDRFKRELDGIQVELQATDPTEMDLDVFRSRAN